jgi:hypothetical protein
MTDIIIISPSDFYKKRKSEPTIYTEKYKELFEKYNCFSDNAVVIVQTQQIIVKTYRKTNIKKENKSIKRILLGILNIINENNYNKMLFRTKILITPDNLKDILTEILDKCVCQIFYLSIYSAFIKDLIGSFTENDKQIALYIINNFIDMFLNNGYILTIIKSDNSYHDFCMMQKNKTEIFSKNLITLEFLITTNYLNNLTLDSYSNTIFTAFLANVNINNEIADVLLHIMLEISKRGHKFDKNILKNIKTIQKLQFVITDLLA